MKYLAAAYSLFLAAIIVLDDMDRLPDFLAVVYNIPYAAALAHFFLMGGLSLLLNLALGSRSRRAHLLATLAVAALVALEEFSHVLFPNRHVHVVDLLISLSGVAIALLIYLKVFNRELHKLR